MRIVQKLVRDKIPLIIENKGQKPVYRVLENDKEYELELNKKLIEEIDEYKEEYNIDEVLDIIEVLMAISFSKGVSQDEVLRRMDIKRQERGGFDKRIFLESVDS